MTRYIDADAVYKILESCEIRKATIGNPLTDWEYGYTCGIERAESEIECATTVDAVPVRHGKWIVRDNPGTGWYRITCSECGEDVTSTAPCIGFFPNAKVSWDYCPYCGARMRDE